MTTRTPDARDVLERLAKSARHCANHQFMSKTVTWEALAVMLETARDTAAQDAASLPEPGAAGEKMCCTVEACNRRAAVEYERGRRDGREACAKLCDQSEGEWSRRPRDSDCARYLAQRIRQRTSQEGNDG